MQDKAHYRTVLGPNGTTIVQRQKRRGDWLDVATCRVPAEAKLLAAAGEQYMRIAGLRVGGAA